MKVSREKSAENRQRVLEVAAVLFREKGFDGIGVADIMKAAGLTHGGFYGQFRSKNDLAAEASRSALATSTDRLKRIADAESDRPLAAIVAGYFSDEARNHPGNGCAFAALASEAARHGCGVQAAFSEGLAEMIDVLATAFPDLAESDRRKSALSAMSEMVGAMILSRVASTADLSEEIIAATTARLCEAPDRVFFG